MATIKLKDVLRHLCIDGVFTLEELKDITPENDFTSWSISRYKLHNLLPIITRISIEEFQQFLQELERNGWEEVSLKLKQHLSTVSGEIYTIKLFKF